MFDFSNPFFKPLSVRIIIVAICLGWSAFEFYVGSPFWGAAFGLAGFICIWHFFYAQDYGSDD